MQNNKLINLINIIKCLVSGHKMVVNIAEHCSCHSDEIQNIGTAPQSLSTTQNYLIVCVPFVIVLFYVLQKLRNYCVLKECQVLLPSNKVYSCRYYLISSHCARAHSQAIAIPSFLLAFRGQAMQHCVIGLGQKPWSCSHAFLPSSF